MTPFEGIDHIMDARDLSAFPDETFAVVYASHVLEHFDYKDELLTVLKEWHRVLMPGGKLLVSVPDLETLCRLFADKELYDVNNRFRLMRMMFGGHTDPFDYHQVGLNLEFLTHYLSEAGFENIQRVNTFGLLNDTSSMRFKGQLISLNLVAERSGIERSSHELAAGMDSAEGGQCAASSIRYKLDIGILLIEKARQLREAGKAKSAMQLLEDVEEKTDVSNALLRERGMTYAYLNEYQKAVDDLEQAQLVLPADYEAQFIKALALYRLRRFNDALMAFEQLIAVAPDISVLHGWRGQILAALKQDHEAHQAFVRALELEPNSITVIIEHAKHLMKCCHPEEATQLLERAATLNPENASVFHELGRSYRQTGCSRQALTSFQTALMLDPNNRTIGSGYLFDLCYSTDVTPEFAAAEHRRVAATLYPAPAAERDTPCVTDSTGKIKIGYLSADFFSHPVIRFLEPVLRHHDRNRCDIYCYASVAKPDAVTERIKQMQLTWRDVISLPPQEVAAQIEADGIDILVDLSGHTAGNRLDVCGLKPAPVQVSWLGYPHSTGLSQIDYYLSDSWCDPPTMTDRLYTEKVWRLPELFCCYQPHDPSPPPERTVDSPFTFGCFNNFAKLTDDQLRLWAVLLKKIPDSRLYLKNSGIGGDKAQQRVRGLFAEYGINPDRIQCHSFVTTFEEHLACYQQVDIALDTFPYHGTTTTCEALWMGVPVVTLAGNSHRSRVGVALLHAVGLDDLVADSPDEYLAIAERLAGDKYRLQQLRTGLRNRLASSPLMAYTSFTRQLEAAFASMCTGATTAV
ncbi:MAG: methyltransferase domain-containing protein [Geobacter sp.]